MSQQEETRTFTPEQSQAMYEALRRIAQVRDGIIRHDERITRRKIAVVKAIKDAEKLLDAIDTQAPATPQPATEPAREPATGRYMVVSHGYGMGSDTGETWGILDTVTGHGVMPRNQRYWYPTEHEAQTEADRLNAGGTGTGG